VQADVEARERGEVLLKGRTMDSEGWFDWKAQKSPGSNLMSSGVEK
jgi:hypothetical protein